MLHPHDSPPLEDGGLCLVTEKPINLDILPVCAKESPYREGRLDEFDQLNDNQGKGVRKVEMSGDGRGDRAGCLGGRCRGRIGTGKRGIRVGWSRDAVELVELAADGGTATLSN